MDNFHIEASLNRNVIKTYLRPNPEENSAVWRVSLSLIHDFLYDTDNGIL